MRLTCPNETFKLDDIPKLYINTLYEKYQWKLDKNVLEKTIIIKCNALFFLWGAYALKNHDPGKLLANVLCYELEVHNDYFNDGFDLLLLICPNLHIIHAALFEIEVHLTSNHLNSTKREAQTPLNITLPFSGLTNFL